MSEDRHSIWWGLILSGAALAMEIFGPPSFFPERLNNAISMTAIVIFVVAIIMLGFLQCAQRNETKDVGRWRAFIVNYQFQILLGLFILAFILGALIAPSKPANFAKRIPLSADSHMTDTSSPVENEGPLPSFSDDTNTVSVPANPIPRVFTPKTPNELMDIASLETNRDAMQYKGDWIRIKGTVHNIFEASSYPSANPEESYIRVEIAIGPPTHNPFTNRVRLYVEAERWKPQVDKLEHGDWLVAIGTVQNIYKRNMDVINGEIISVSGSDSEL